MDHKYINEVDLVGRYLMRKLAPEEIAEFEAHFVDCRECVDQLNTSKAIMEGLRIVANANAVEPQRYEARRASWLLPRLSLRNSLALAAGVLLLVASATIVVSNEIRRSRAEAAQARIASAESERRYEEERQSSSLAELRHQDSDRDLKTQLAQLRAELDRQNTMERADDHSGLKTPQVNVEIFQLESTRGSEPAGGALLELSLPRSPTDFVILVPLAGESRKDYSMTLRDGRGEVIWKKGGFKPNSHNSLSAGFNSTFFHDGDYSLTVEAVAGDGSKSVVGKYSLRLRKTP